VLHNRHFGSPITKIIEGHHVLAIIRDTWSHAKISRHKPLALRISEVEYVADSSVRGDLGVGPRAVHVSPTELGRRSHRHQRPSTDT
jgi:hypothetical protein